MIKLKKNACLYRTIFTCNKSSLCHRYEFLRLELTFLHTKKIAILRSIQLNVDVLTKIFI